MADDIVPELMARIRRDFSEAALANERIQKFMKRIRDGTVGMDDASLFARDLGDILAEVLKRDITRDILPGGRMYYNIADRTIRPMLMETFRLTNEAARTVMEFLDGKDGIRLKALEGEWPEERVDTLIGAIGEDGIEWEEAERRMDEPVRNIAQGFFDEFVKANAEFRYRSGMREKIVRKLKGDACEWCRSLAGCYEYPDVPKDIYRRHDNCRCTVTFVSEKRRQDVWTKNTWTTPEQRERRRAAGLDLTRRTGDEARRWEEELDKGRGT